MTTQDQRAIDNAWQIHSQLADWTGKVDRKASFAVSFISAVIAGVIAIYGDGTRLYGGKTRITDFSDLESVFFVGGILFAVLGFVLSIVAVIPQMRGRTSKKEFETGVVYFGHLRHWQVYDLTIKLRDADILPMLTRQLVNMSKIVWRKHRAIQCSFLFAIFGIELLALAELLANT